ncbi:putative E3 ubiquitin-protein ligase [Collariella sp. IMI 366227]|nr:putative E3 ubiquitin-protein ligase [Collariella sp. IMI 366227]
MAPWPDRTGSQRQADPAPRPTRQQHLTTRQPQPAPTTGRYRSASRVSEVDVWDNLQNHQIQVDSNPKLLLLGDFAENGTWWTGQEALVPDRTPSGRSQNGLSAVSSRNPHIDWAALEEWYTTVIEAARTWADVYEGLVADEPALAVAPDVLKEIEGQILSGQEHTQRALLQASETILKRPGRRISEPQELRFLLIIATNPLLYAGKFTQSATVPTPSTPSTRGSGPATGRHSVIIKRIVGLMSNTPTECHNYLMSWFARYPEAGFIQLKDMVSGFLAFRLLRQNEKKYEAQIDLTAGLVPNMSANQSPALLHAALGQSQRQKKKDQEKKKVVYQEDWQIKAAAQVLAFMFAANNMGYARRSLPSNRPDITTSGNKSRELVQAPGQILATSDFYMTLLDDSDLVADFDAWERKQARFSFCYHPFLLSIGAKIQILEHDARRQMENRARDAFFDSIMTNRMVQQFLMLDIRRECLVEDSLKAVSMFLYDEDSHYCYFNPNSLEPSEQFFLVGVVMGLAIYNSTILDYRPSLARGLRQLLDFDGDVESTFCLDFSIDTERYGNVEKVLLCPGGDRRPVTNSNRREYVDAYIRHTLDSSVTRQFEPFKRGFFTVVADGPALSLFRPEEIELLIRGSSSTHTQPLDIAALKTAAHYDGWPASNPAEEENTVVWFWEEWEGAEPRRQRELLAFVTGSDRVPAMGAASLGIRVSDGEDVF